MTRLHRDYETFSACDIKKQGHHRYVRHPSTEALMLGWAFDDDEPQVWDIASGEPMPRDLADGYRDPGVDLWAFNASFEAGVDHHVMGLDIPITRYRCCQVLGYSVGLGGQVNVPNPGAKDSVFSGLAAMLLEMRAPEEHWKDTAGKRLIQVFSVPQPKGRKVSRCTQQTHPEDWERFKSYCAQDVRAERWLYHALSKYGTMTPYEWAEWHWDQIMNDRGLPVDMALVRQALAVRSREVERLMAELKRMTGLENPNSNSQMLGWLRSQGLPLENLRKETIAQYVQSIDDDEGDEDE